MPPIGLDGHGLRQRIHGVKNNRICIAKELDEGIVLFTVTHLVFRIRGVDHAGTLVIKTPAVRIAAMVLLLQVHLHARDGLCHAWLMHHKLDVCAHVIKADRKRRTFLLPSQGEFGVGVPTMDHDLVSGQIGWGEKWEPHDVIPVQMGQKHMVNLRCGRTVALQNLLSQRAYPTAKIQYEMFRPVGDQLNTAGVTAKSARDIKAQSGNELINFCTAGKGPTIGRLQRGSQLVADVLRGQRNRNRAPRSPKVNFHRSHPTCRCVPNGMSRRFLFRVGSQCGSVLITAGTN